MTAKQQAFIDNYLVTFSAAKAARAAGYSPATAKQQGSKLLRVPAIQAAINRAKVERAMKLEITEERVLQELHVLCFARLDHFVVRDDGSVSVREGVPPEYLGAIESCRRRVTRDYDGKIREESAAIRLFDKTRSVQLAMKHLGILRDSLEISVGEAAKQLVEGAAESYRQKLDDLAARLAAREKKEPTH